MGEPEVRIRRRPNRINCPACGSRKQSINYHDHKNRPHAVLLCPTCDLKPCVLKRFVITEHRP